MSIAEAAMDGAGTGGEGPFRRLALLRPAGGSGGTRAALILLAAAVLSLSGSLALRRALGVLTAHQHERTFIRAARRGFSDRDLALLMQHADPGAVRFALDHNPDGPQIAWTRPPGWKRLDIETVPTLGLGKLSMSAAQRINGVIPNSQFANPPMTPFVLHAAAAEREAAIGCLTAAIYYEGALEPRDGQEAVAQVVINRMRHAGFPKSICGVVFQGADRPGCQFSFACDGSMARPPAAWAWRNARDVAVKALNGYVMKAAGGATHYHTDWIMAPWTPTVIKVGRFGSQIFFRPTGPDGQPSAFEEPYRGGEARASRLDLIGKPAVLTAPALLQASAPGSVVAAASIVKGGRRIVLPEGSLALGATAANLIGAQSGQAPMHAMIALRAEAARARARNAAATDPRVSGIQPQTAPGPTTEATPTRPGP